MTETIGFIAAVLTTSSSVPQLIKIIKTKSAEDVSSVMFTLIVLGNIMWLIYGLKTAANPLIYSAIVAILINAGTLIARMKYKNSQNHCQKEELSTSKVS